MEESKTSPKNSKTINNEENLTSLKKKSSNE
ncbi:MAG: hypothetical protein MRECE_38c019 [Mycoplasmataceae bacterium CE_OT135]|nr:MAG: hypothetical protein MRECE_38c019 [Mycoplasmataceae bacterium CE_OT135]